MTDPTPAPVPPATKPAYKQVSNYAGVTLVAVATYLVTNEDVIVAILPPPYGKIVAFVLGAVAAGLFAYKEKVKTP